MNFYDFDEFFLIFDEFYEFLMNFEELYWVFLLFTKRNRVHKIKKNQKYIKIQKK